MVTIREMPSEHDTPPSPPPPPPPPPGPPEFTPPRRRGCISAFIGLLIALAVLVVAGIYFHKLQYATSSIMDNDGYFHIKYSYLMSHGQGIIKKLPWLQYTIHAREYRDHHFGFHLLYVPFTFGDLREGAKTAAWVYSVLAVFMFYWVAARRGRVTAAILTFVLLGASWLFLSRMCMARVNSLSLVALLLGIHLIITRRYRWLAAVMFGYVWLYDGFILLAGAAACFFVAEALVERRLNWALLKWTALGMAAGIVINPYFPGNIASYMFNLSRTAGTAQLIERTGWEWLPLGTWELFTMSKGIWIALGLGGLLGLLRGRPTRETVGLFLMAFLATLLMLKARRYMEIWPPLVLLFFAYAWSDYWIEAVWQRPLRGVVARSGATVALAFLILLTPAAFRDERARIINTKPNDYFQGAAEFVRSHSEPGSIIFNTDWDDFPYLFFFDSDNYYVVGLDQLYMKRYDPDLFDLWEKISNGSVEDPGLPIWERFSAPYAIVDRQARPLFLLRALRDPNMKVAYEDKGCVVFRIEPPR